jgi:hypothetical protein
MKKQIFVNGKWIDDDREDKVLEKTIRQITETALQNYNKHQDAKPTKGVKRK